MAKKEERNWKTDPRLPKSIMMLTGEKPKTIPLPSDGSVTNWVMYAPETSKAAHNLAKNHGVKIFIIDKEKIDDVISILIEKSPELHAALYSDAPKAVQSEPWVLLSGELNEILVHFAKDELNAVELLDIEKES